VERNSVTPLRSSDAPRALVVGGDDATRAMLHFLLADLGCAVGVAPTIAAFTTPTPPASSAEDAPTLLVCVADVPADLPTLTAAAGRQASRPALLVLARRLDRALRQAAFAAGAIDVVGLPAVPRELHARLHAMLVSAGTSPRPPARPASLHAGGLTLHLAGREMTDEASWRARLTTREVAVLADLMSRPGIVVHKHDLLDAVWGTAYEGDGNVLEVYIGRLRVKLARPDARPVPLRTLRGQGYLFEARATPRLPARVG